MSPRHWPQLCEAMDRPDLADDERYITNGGRVRHKEALEAEIRAWTTQHRRGELAAMAKVTDFDAPFSPFSPHFPAFFGLILVEWMAVSERLRGFRGPRFGTWTTRSTMSTCMREAFWSGRTTRINDSIRSLYDHNRL